MKKRNRRILLPVLFLALTACMLLAAACGEYNPRELQKIRPNAVMNIEHNVLFFAKDMTVDTADIVEKSNCVLEDNEGNTAKITAEHIRKGAVKCEEFDLTTTGTEKQISIKYKDSENFIIYTVTDYNVSFYLDEEKQTLWKNVPASAALNDELQLSVWIEADEYNFSTDITARQEQADLAIRFNGWYDSATNSITGDHSLAGVGSGEVRTLDLHAHFLTEPEFAKMQIEYDGRNRRVFKGYTGSEETLTIPEGVTFIDLFSVFDSAENSFTKIIIPSTASMELPLQGLLDTTNLEEIEVNDGSRSYASYEGALYSKDFESLYLMPASADTLLHDDVKILERYSCAYWKAKSVNLPDGVIKLGNYCFAYSNLTQAIGSDRTEVEKGIFVFWESKIPMTYDEANGGYYTASGDGKFSLSRVNTDVTSFTLLPGTISIASDAFNGCKNLQSIDLSNSSVERIGSSAFSNCSSLESVKLPSTLKYMGKSIFYKCENLREVTGLTSVTFVDGAEQFESTLPESIFEHCTSLQSVTLPDGYKVIGKSAFYNCRSLTNLSLKEGLEEIQESAFFSCGFTGLTLPTTLNTLGDKAFYGSKLASIDLERCTNLTALSVRCFQETDLTEVTIPERITALPNYCFYLNEKLETVTLKKVTELGQYCFGYCYALETIDLGDSLKTVNTRAFSNCYKLDNVDLPNTVQTVQSYAFQRCDGLTRLKLGSGVATFGTYTMLTDANANHFNATSLALWQCYNLQYIDVSEENENFASVNGVLFGKSAATFTDFESKTSILYAMPADYREATSFTLPADAKVILPYSVQSQKGITQIILNEGLQNIGKCAFYQSTSITGLTIPKTVTTIGSNILLDCTGITSFDINAENETYKLEGDVVYSGSTLVMSVGLTQTDIVIKDGVTTIFDGAFMNNHVIQSVTTKDVVTVNGNAFNGCDNLKTLNIGSSLKTIAATSFAKLSALETITVADSENFKAENNILYSFDGKTLLLCAAKNGLTSLDGITGITSISDYAFSYHATLESVKLPAGVTKIGNYSFYDCRKVVEFYSSEALKSIGQYAFAFASTLNPSIVTDTRASDVLKTIVLYGDLATVGNNAFYGQFGIEKLYLKMTEEEYDAMFEANKSVTNLSYLFLGCPMLNQPGKYYNNDGKGVKRYLYMQNETSIPAPDGFEWFHFDGNDEPTPWTVNTSEE